MTKYRKKAGTRGRLKTIKTMQVYYDWWEIRNKRGNESGNRGSEGNRKENNNDRRQEMKNKEKIDKIINAVAVMAIISFFIGAMVAIWIGFVGVKVLLSAVVLFIGDYATFFWISTVNKEKQRKESERGRRQA